MAIHADYRQCHRGWLEKIAGRAAPRRAHILAPTATGLASLRSAARYAACAQTRLRAQPPPRVRGRAAAQRADASSIFIYY